MSNKQKVTNVAILGVFGAVVAVLQLLSYAIKIGTFNLSLVLIPIVLGAYLYGPKKGAILGGIFGAVVVICCFAGMDAGGYILISANPLLTTAVCMVKGIAAGFVPGIIAKALGKKCSPYLTIILCAISAPIVNTGLFTASMFLFFKDTLTEWAGGTNVVTYAIVGLIGVNFIIEFVVNALAAPSLLRVKKSMKR